MFTVDTDYRDFDITFKTSRQNWQRVGIGFRHIDFDENNGLRIGGIFSSAGGDNALSDEALIAAGLSGGSGGIADGDPLTVAVNATNDNNLNGLQLTYDAAIVNGSIWVFDVFANIGLYHNQITNRFTERYIAGAMGGNVYGTSARDSENDLAWAGQIGFSGGVKLNDNWQFLAGYELLYIDGLGLGVKLPPASGSESVFINGGRLGFQGTW
jgi:hypothetical protein